MRTRLTSTKGGETSPGKIASVTIWGVTKQLESVGCLPGRCHEALSRLPTILLLKEEKKEKRREGGRRKGGREEGRKRGREERRKKRERKIVIPWVKC